MDSKEKVRYSFARVGSTATISPITVGPFVLYIMFFGLGSSVWVGLAMGIGKFVQGIVSPFFGNISLVALLLLSQLNLAVGYCKEINALKVVAKITLITEEREQR